MCTRGALCIVVFAAAACGPAAVRPEPQRSTMHGPFIAGRTYLSAHEFIRYRSGDAPFVISVPHDGTRAPSAIPDRTSGTTTGDRHTLELATQLAASWRARTNQTPHVVICDLRRTKVDVNRDAAEAAGDNPLARQAWADYHASIEAALRTALDSAPRALYVDLHGHAHPDAFVELGYLLKADDLAASDDRLVAGRGPQRSSLRALAGDAPLEFVSLLRGPASLGAKLAARGYDTVPSPTRPHPAGAPYFSGGYSLERHAGPRVVAVQIEAPFEGVRQNTARRATFATALADALLEWREGW